MMARSSLRPVLVSIDWLQEKDEVRTRRFSMETFSRSGPLAINGKHMDMNRIDETVKLGTTEIWEITNVSTGMMQMPRNL